MPSIDVVEAATRRRRRARVVVAEAGELSREALDVHRAANLAGGCSARPPPVAHPRRAVATESSMLASPRIECASVEQTSLTPGLDRLPHVDVAQVEPVGQAVHLERDVLLERDLDQPVDVELVLGAAVDVAGPSGARGRRRAGCAAPRSTRSVCSRFGRRWPPWTLACTQSSSREDRSAAGRAGRPGGCRTRCRAGRGRARAHRSTSAISSAWRRRSSGVQAAHGADGRRVVADREVLVAALDRGERHLLDARPPVRPGGVRSAGRRGSRASSTSGGGSSRNGCSRSSGGQNGIPSAR